MRELAANLASPLPYFVTKYRVGGDAARDRRACATDGRRGRAGLRLPEPVRQPAAPRVALRHRALSAQRRGDDLASGTTRCSRTRSKKAYLYGQWRKARAYERAACRRFDHVVAVSREDREMMQRDYGLEAVSDVPTGVDTEYFRPRATERARAAQSRLHRLDGLAAERRRDPVLHRPRSCRSSNAQVPDATLTVVGRNPYRESGRARASAIRRSSSRGGSKTCARTWSAPRPTSCRCASAAARA